MSSVSLFMGVVLGLIEVSVGAGNEAVGVVVVEGGGDTVDGLAGAVTALPCIGVVGAGASGGMICLRL
jgi:hypothetical protein